MVDLVLRFEEQVSTNTVTQNIHKLSAGIDSITAKNDIQLLNHNDHELNEDWGGGKALSL